MEKVSVFTLKSEVAPIAFLILLGTIDCVTTVIGVLYYGAVELNPLMKGIVGANITAFTVLKLFSTFLIGFTYLLAKKTLSRTTNKQTKTFRYSKTGMKFVYAALVTFLIIVVLNNFTVLLA